MKRSHEEPDPYGGRRPGPTGLTTASHPPAGLPPGHAAQFSHPVLAPGQLAHSFEQMRDLPRPSFSSHLPVPNASANPQPVAPPAHLSQPTPPGHPQAKPNYQTLPSNPTHVTATGQQQYQRLKVEDALSYLDQVKLQFGNQPQVYNEFLDIMKEFKSQTIDTPGVISRVSALFKGHPDLIVGFNTFLPPGYKIEVSLTDINTVNVCAPTGTTTHLISGSGLIAAPPPNPANKPPSVPPVTTNTSSTSSGSTPTTTTATSTSKSPSTATSLPTSAPPKTTSPALPPAASLTLSSPGMQSQTQAQHHAINYVTKIKNRFQGQPEVYQKFLDILNNYQTEQKSIKENSIDQYGRPLQEHEVFVKEGKLASDVYAQVAKLFNKQDDLLKEFSQFLPDATGSSFAGAGALTGPALYQPLSKKPLSGSNTSKLSGGKPKKPSGGSQNNSVKSEPMDVDAKDNEKSKKRPKSALKDVTLAEAVKLGNFGEFAFFEKVRKALKSPDVYENFLRCLVLFNQEVISRPELIQLATTFLGKFPDLFTWFKMFLGYKENQQTETNITGFKDRGTGGELAHLEIDFRTCKRSGESYRAYPKSYVQPKCQGRSQLCKEVLNDTWVSLPTWSEDTQFPGTRKTQYEEYIYKCEDERFELDIVIETNLSTIKVLEGVQKKMSRMNSDEQQKFRLDNSLGGSSDIIHRKAIFRIYGDKSPEVIDGLKKTPHMVLPIVLKRLKQKDEEWRSAQKQFNKVWRDQNEKFYLKSLDHQGINFKQNDLKTIRTKSLIREIEQILEERTDQMEEGNTDVSGPHLTFHYKDQSILEDACALIIHHMKRQTSIQKDDKTKIKSVLRMFMPDLFFAPTGELSDDEQELDDDDMSEKKVLKEKPTSRSSTPVLVKGDCDDMYNLIFVNNTWYILLRLHHCLCERLLKMYQLAMKIAAFEANDRKYRREGTAEALQLKKPAVTDVEDFYPTFQDMVKNLLDGQLEPNIYEDTLREIFGVNSYIAFTMDKLIQNIVRQLHALVMDEATLKVMEMYKEEKENKATGGPSFTATSRLPAELAYQKKMENHLVDENCYKIYFYQDKNCCKMSMELLPAEDDQSEDQTEIEKWSEYIDKYIGDSEIAADLREHLQKKPIFLLKNTRVLSKRIRSYKDALTEKESDSKATDQAEAKKEDNIKEKEGEQADNKEQVVDANINDGKDIDSIPNVFLVNGLGCKISTNSYKMKYVSGTCDFMYRKNTLTNAMKTHPKINLKLHDAFNNYHSSWLHENTTRDQCHQSEEWLLGKTANDGFLPCLTTKDTGRVSGLSVNKYSVVYTKDLKQGPAQPSTASTTSASSP